MYEFLRNILHWIYTIVGSYGIAIVLFTLLIKMVLLPFDVKSRKSMRRTTQLQPQLAELQKKYKNDKDKLNQKTMELYRKEKISPMSGCLPMLLTLPVLFAMFGAMRMVANEQIATHVFHILSTGTAPQFESFLWIKNIWMPDSPFTAVLPDAMSISQIPLDRWQYVFQNLDATTLAALPDFVREGFSSALTSTTLQPLVNTMVETMNGMEIYQMETALSTSGIAVFFRSIPLLSLQMYQSYNGLFILPVLAAATQFLMTALNPQQQQPAPSADGKPAAGTGAFMKWFFPIFSLYICSTSNAGFALYWVTTNIIAAVQNFILNKYLDAKDKKVSTVGEGIVK